MVATLQSGAEQYSIGEAAAARDQLTEQGASIPTWAEARDGAQPPKQTDGHEMYDFKCGRVAKPHLLVCRNYCSRASVDATMHKVTQSSHAFPSRRPGQCLATRGAF